MKYNKSVILVLGILGHLFSLASCQTAYNGNKKTNDTKGITIPDFTIMDFTKEDFDFSVSNNTSFYHALSYEGLTGKVIKYDPKDIKEIQARIRYNVSFIQYTIDDNPASALEYIKKSEWIALKASDGEISIPDVYDNSQQKKLHEILACDQRELPQALLGDSYFEKLRLNSHKTQKEFYNNLLTNQDNYAECCPEYIQQAKKFMTTDFSDFKTMDDLGVEMDFDDFVIEVNGTMRNDQPFKKVIVVD